MSNSSNTMHDFHAEHHVQPASFYWKTFALLTILMGLTIGAAQLPHSVPFFGTQAGTFAMNFIALGIAFTKATYVILNFMGVKFADGVTKMYVLAGPFTLLLFLIMWVDYFSRPYENVRGFDSKPPLAMPRHGYPDPVENENLGEVQKIRPFQQN